jgi:hypothetical protein
MDSIENAPGHVLLNLCFASGGICGSRSVLRCVQGMKHRCTIFLAQVGLVRILEKDASRHVTPNFCFCIRWDMRVT